MILVAQYISVFFYFYEYDHGTCRVKGSGEIINKKKEYANISYVKMAIIKL